jgi:hypothetical protein
VLSGAGGTADASVLSDTGGTADGTELSAERR